MVIKPSPETVLDTFLLAEVVDEVGLPPGVVNLVPGGRELGAYLVGHPGVDKVGFTGSTRAGRSIAEVCGRLLRPVTLELGGKSAAIILDDADLGSQRRGAVASTMLNNGQTCFLGTRILAPQSRYDEVVGTITDMARSAVVGDPLEEKTMVGPMSSSRHRRRSRATSRRAGRRRPHHHRWGGRQGRDTGWFLEPTIFADVDNTPAPSRRRRSSVRCSP